MKRFFKCYDPCTINCAEQVIFLWADNKKAALRKCADIHKGLKPKIYDAPVRTVMEDWEVREYIVPKECNVFAAYPREINRVDDVQFIIVPFGVRDVKEYVFEKLVEKESKEEYFRKYLMDKSMNFSFNEIFWCDSDGWIFTETLDVRDDIKKKVIVATMSLRKYLDNFWLHNVDIFFQDNQVYKGEFINYIGSDQKPEFEDGFFFYVCKKLMKSGQWVTYDDIRAVNIIA